MSPLTANNNTSRAPAQSPIDNSSSHSFERPQRAHRAPRKHIPSRRPKQPTSTMTGPTQFPNASSVQHQPPLIAPAPSTYRPPSDALAKPQQPSQLQPPQPNPQAPLRPPLQLQTQQTSQIRPIAVPRKPSTTAVPRPPVSPITPPLKPTKPAQSSVPTSTLPPPAAPDFAKDRPALTHKGQKTQAGITPPPPVPLDLSTNPDAIALRSAIAILQNQRRRAEADIVALQTAKDAALENPMAFRADLLTGNLRPSGGGFFNSNEIIPSSADESSSEDGDEDEQPPTTESEALERLRRKQERTMRKNERARRKAAEPAWRRMPQPQNVVRMPPINWSQYAVVGESLDKLHAEQLTKPPEGAPATIGAGGVYQFHGENGPGKKYAGIAAPYSPAKDRLPDKKRKK